MSSFYNIIIQDLFLGIAYGYIDTIVGQTSVFKDRACIFNIVTWRIQ